MQGTAQLGSPPCSLCPTAATGGMPGNGHLLPTTSGTCAISSGPTRSRSTWLRQLLPPCALRLAWERHRDNALKRASRPDGCPSCWLARLRFAFTLALALRPPGDGVGGYLPNGGPGSQGYDVYTPDSRPRGEAQPASREGRAPSPSARRRRGVSASPSLSAPSIGRGPHPWPATQGWT